MTVLELIQALAAYPMDLPVWVGSDAPGGGTLRGIFLAEHLVGGPHVVLQDEPA